MVASPRTDRRDNRSINLRTSTEWISGRTSVTSWMRPGQVIVTPVVVVGSSKD
jgi:hypothetical protein